MMIALLALHNWNIKNTIVIWITCWTTACLVGLSTLCLTSIIILLLFPLFFYLLKHHHITSRSLALLPWLFLLASIILSCYYGPSYGETTFESRFSIPALVYQKHGLSLFGQDYGFVGFGKAWRTGLQPLSVDNIYLHLFLCNGVLIALFIFLFLSHYLYRIGKMEDPFLTSSAIGLTLAGLMENIPLDALTNFFLLYYFHHFTPFPKQVQKGLAIAIVALAVLAIINYLE
ncbi:MAG: hypothetical protein IKX25_04065 [Bacteroidales bacterium]|nr:hypothetical protein [Bacteroidales bacterium]